jgi:hypothetical protein
VQSILVGLRIDGDRFYAHFACGLDDPAGDFAAIGHENTLEHAVSVGPIAGLLACVVIAKKSIALYGGRKTSVGQSAIPAAATHAIDTVAR